MDIKQWINIPHRSTLFMMVTSTDGNFLADGELSVDGQPPHRLLHNDLVNGTTITLHSPHRYAATVRLIFTGGAVTNVDLNAEVTTAAGNRHGSSFRHSVSGDNGDLDSVLIDALTAP